MGLLRRLFGGDPGTGAQPERPAAADPEVPSDVAACPHCGTTLNPIPPRRRLCPKCRQPIIPRTRADGVRVVLREADLHALDEWDRAWRAQRQHETWVEKAAELVGPAEAAAIDEELRAKDKGYSGQDVYWAAANRAVLRALKGSDWDTAQMVYFGMALTAYKESDEDQESERVLRLKREANLAQLRSYAASGLQRVDIFACECRVCSRGAKSRLTIKDQLAAPSIPHRNCAEGWCNCDYVPRID